jgi:hypothetical protein
MQFPAFLTDNRPYLIADGEVALQSLPPTPGPLYTADNGLAAGMDVDVFDRDFLLTFATMTVERFKQRRISAA